MTRWFVRALLVVSAITALLAAAGALTLRASLPDIDGELAVAGVGAELTIERDAAGIATISAATRDDLAFGLGFAHAQDRYFQMDLMRRRAAGELAALVGPAALPLDRRGRLHRFRARATTAIRQLTPGEKAVLDAYVAGVNAGLSNLGARPFEYFLLRATPDPWTAEDTMLVAYSMFMELNDERALRDVQRGIVHRRLPTEVFDWLYPRGTSWDSALTGDVIDETPMPPASIYDLRNLPAASASAAIVDDEGVAPGSNNWAVAGTLTDTGRAIVANDMHLRITVPNIFYRARLTQSQGDVRDLSGVTLPGTPVMVAGSNGHIAWGLTNSYGDWSDAVVLVPGDAEGTYQTPAGLRQIETFAERIDVNGGPQETLIVRETRWGPIVEDAGYADGEVTVSWIAHATAGVNLGHLELETVENVEQAIRIANRLAIPPQNFVVGDAEGNIGWTIAGRMPRRGDAPAEIPADWSQGGGWQGWWPPDSNPRIVNPPSGRIWTANTRVVNGAELTRIGDGGYYLGARGGQIRDGLNQRDRFAPTDMLAIHLDDRALFLERWRTLLLDTLDAEALRDRSLRAEFRELAAGWEPRASASSVGYRLVREFRSAVREQAFRMLTAPVRQTLDEDRPLRVSSQFEGPLWQLLRERPRHLLGPEYESWQAFLLTALDGVIEEHADNYADGPAARHWGETNTASIRHPLSRAVPILSRWLDMPAEPLNGDTHMPRVQRPAFGAAERFAVSPGDETNGYLHMPAGQSGHPLSPFYRQGHADWVQGRPSAFLPGNARYSLRLAPDD